MLVTVGGTIVAKKPKKPAKPRKLRARKPAVAPSLRAFVLEYQVLELVHSESGLRAVRGIVWDKAPNVRAKMPTFAYSQIADCVDDRQYYAYSKTDLVFADERNPTQNKKQCGALDSAIEPWYIVKVA